MPRRRLFAVVLTCAAAGLPLLAVAFGQDWYLDGPALVLLALVAGYAAGAWLPRSAALAAVVIAVAALVTANQLHGADYHPLDDLVFFVAIVGGPAAAGAAVTLRAQQVGRLERLQRELAAQQETVVAAARLEEQSRVQQEVHSRLAERIAAIALSAEGAQRAGDAGAMGAIEAEARGVLDQLRSALGSLGSESAEPTRAAEHTPAEAPVPVRTTPSDVVLAVGLGLALAVETAVAPAAEGPLWANVLAAFTVTAPLVVRRARPILAVGCSSLAAVAMSAWLTPVPATVTGVALILVVFYTVGAWCQRWWWLVGWAVAFAGMWASEAVSGLASDGETGDGAWIVVLLTSGAVAVGRITAGWQERLRRTEQVVGELERGRGAAVRLATAQERQALASELHDTVAHAMTVVCLQAAAQRHTGSDPAPALRTIAETAAGSLAELRDGLDAIEAGEHPLEPSRITALGRRVGVDVAAETPTPGVTGPGASLAFRVVREAVVNVARHAPGASARVRVRYVDDALSVEVVDDGAPDPSWRAGAGRGLAGLSEAVATAGGRLDWGPCAGGGFRVAALIPRRVS